MIVVSLDSDRSEHDVDGGAYTALVQKEMFSMELLARTRVGSSRVFDGDSRTECFKALDVLVVRAVPRSHPPAFLILTSSNLPRMTPSR
jgi:hypothetical protein